MFVFYSFMFVYLFFYLLISNKELIHPEEFYLGQYTIHPYVFV